MSEKDINDFAENRRRYQPSTASTRIRQWWPLLFVLIGLALLVPRFFEFAEEPAWLSIVADVAGLLMILAGLITFTMPRRQDNYRTESIVDTPELQEEYFPFHIANSITEMINILLPEPAGNDNFLSDKDIPYIPRD